MNDHVFYKAGNRVSNELNKFSHRLALHQRFDSPDMVADTLVTHFWQYPRTVLQIDAAGRHTIRPTCASLAQIFSQMWVNLLESFDTRHEATFLLVQEADVYLCCPQHRLHPILHNPSSRTDNFIRALTKFTVNRSVDTDGIIVDLGHFSRTNFLLKVLIQRNDFLRRRPQRFESCQQRFKSRIEDIAFFRVCN